MTWIIAAGCAIVAGLAGLWIGIAVYRRIGRARLTDAESLSRKLLEDTRKEAELLKKTAAIEAREAGGERGDEVRVGAAEGHGFQKLV